MLTHNQTKSHGESWALDRGRSDLHRAGGCSSPRVRPGVPRFFPQDLRPLFEGLDADCGRGHDLAINVMTTLMYAARNRF